MMGMFLASSSRPRLRALRLTAPGVVACIVASGCGGRVGGGASADCTGGGECTNDGGGGVTDGSVDAGTVDAGTDGGEADSATGIVPPVVIASAQQRPVALVVNETSIYWMNAGGGTSPLPVGTVMSAPLAGGPATTLASDPNGAGPIALDGTNVYWADPAALMKVPLGGGSPTQVASVLPWGANAFTVSPTSVYWTSQNPMGVSQVPLTGGSPTVLSTDQSPVGIAVDATDVYWCDGVGSVMKMPLDGGTPVTLASVKGLPCAQLTVDAANVYWTTSSLSQAFSVMKVPLDGGTPVTLAPSNPGGTNGIAVDTTRVYWTLITAPYRPDGGAVMSVPIAGGAATTLATGQAGIGGIAVDATSVYWADMGTLANNFEDGAVMRLTPK
jgi:hypothetical protein